MEENNIYLRSLNTFNGWKFIIKDYQRGYRWNKQQVIDLLNDLNEFRIKANKEENEIYCLQPIIIKKIKENEYELIDGQQRLTTIYMLLKYIRKLAFGGIEKIKYDIIYEAKDNAINLENQKSAYFLNNIDDINLSKTKNLDFYFMKNAYDTIENWFNNNIDLAERMNDLLTNAENNKVKFICFEIAENRKDSEKIFSRINNNQIKLTDSELIKAQILFNVGSSNESSLLEQINISNEWNNMESILYDDSFWYFLSIEEIKDNRTKLIFDYLAKQYDDTPTNRKYDTFEKVMEHLKQVDSKDFWNNEVHKILNIFRDWYEKVEIYNYIGYLNNVKEIEVYELLDLYKVDKDEKQLSLPEANEDNIKTRDDLILHLKKIIIEYIKKIKIEELIYSDKDNQKIKAVLLLFNVLTTMMDSTFRKFPFDQYKKNKWEIEHLHPQNEKEPNEENYQDWLNSVNQYINLLFNQKDIPEEKLNYLVKKINNINPEERKNVYFEVTETLKEIMKIDIHKIGNLVLLDKKRNIIFSNKFFNEKRNELINDNTSIYTPICTRNAFLKVYSSNLDTLSIWTKDDMIDYREKLLEELQYFINGGGENNGTKRV